MQPSRMAGKEWFFIKIQTHCRSQRLRAVLGRRRSLSGLTLMTHRFFVQMRFLRSTGRCERLSARLNVHLLPNALQKLEHRIPILRCARLYQSRLAVDLESHEAAARADDDRSAVLCFGSR